MTPELREALAAAQAARLALQRIDDAILPHKVAFQEATRSLVADRETVAAIAEECEARLRAAAERAFEATGNKHPVDGVTVKVFTRLEYDEALARIYCMHNDGAHAALKLDRRRFEEIARERPIEFVRSVQVPQATLAKDLGEPTPAAPGDDEW